ncbi:MAG: 5-methyltetrahydrofolate--homocysteine methyltransferase [Phycisphaerae bacterium]|nr:MAG: 5-methyltetrahydrofolate--homocysteine methyltransferase [Phycisphaerae bacterium]
MASQFLDALRSRVLVFDGAMGTSIHQRDLDLHADYCGCENCTDILAQTRPDVIQEIHESFLAVGADCVETDSFGANRLVLAEFGIADRAFAMSKAAAEVARAACDRHATKDKPRFAVGSMGPGTKLITLGNTDWEAMFASYREQAAGLLAGGVDAFIIETCQDLLQVKCAINAVLAAFDAAGKSPLDVPILASVTIETTGTMLLGTEIAAAAHALAGYPICSLGLNCATGPTEMADHVKWLGHHWPAMSAHGRAVSVMPNAGLPILVDGRTEYPLQPRPFADAIAQFVERDGVRLVGGCCGTTPEHIRLVAGEVEALTRRGATRAAREIVAPAPAVTSLYSPTDYRQDTSILIVGERMNSSGSRAFKKLLEAEDWDGIVSLAREQVRHDGAHVLDLNVDYAGRDNARDMREVMRRVVRQVNVPLMLDSTQLGTIEAGLRLAGGKCIINSANFEEGDEKFDAVCRLAKIYGAALVIGSIDEDKDHSMARTADRKLAIARRGYDRATRTHGLAPADLLFDPLVLPISTGMESDRRSALETIEGVRRIVAALPESQTTVGLSNVSFGLKPAARVVLNSAFLHELQHAGLTSAILHFSKILPKNKIPDGQWAAALDLIYDRRDGGDPLARFIDLFKDAESATTTKKVAKALTLEERLRAHIVDGEKEGLAATLDEARKVYPPLTIINDHLLDGMKTVGDLFGSGQMQLPFVLQSAEVMKAAVALLEPHMEKAAGTRKGSIVLATVKGDVHDIGKNLVDIILTNNGYTVHNLGIKQPLADIVKAWKEHRADAIGLSGLLVKSVNVMEENLKELNAMGLTPPVILGGAALTRHYCESHLRATYRGDCLYGKDAFDGLRTMDYLVSGRTAELAREIDDRQAKRSKAEELITATRAAKLAQANSGGAPPAPITGVRSDVRTDVPIPTPPFWGTRVVDGLDLHDIYPFINPVALFRGQWQVKKGALSDAEYDALVEDKIQPLFEKLKAECRERQVLRPAVVYGYFPCNSDGEDLVIWNDPSRSDGLPRERLRFTFPRQSDKRRLCISDYFRPIDSGETDVLGMHCVTMGSAASQEAKKLFEANRYQDYLYLHGLGVETAEALAEFWHKRMRQELGIAGDDSPKIKDLFTQHYRGSRYSFGYPACPSMADQEKLFALLDPSRIGCVLTENWQIDPEQSTSAIIVHHPEAKYFNV